MTVSLYKSDAQGSTETYQQAITLSRTSTTTVTVEPGASAVITYSGSLPTLITSMYYVVRLTISTQGITHTGDGIFAGNAATFKIT